MRGDRHHHHHHRDRGHSQDESKKQRGTTSLLQRLSLTANLLKEVLPKQHGVGSFGVDGGSGSDNDGGKSNDGIYYEDNFNELPWKCSFGTSEEDGIWMNTGDGSGAIMASMVWVMICK